MVIKTDYRLIQEQFALTSTFIKLPVVINTFVLSILSGRFTQVLLYTILWTLIHFNFIWRQFTIWTYTHLNMQQSSSAICAFI